MRSTSMLLAALLSLLWTRDAHAQRYYGLRIDDTGAAFVLDVSGSMEDKVEGVGRGGLLRQGLRTLAERARRTELGRSRVGQAVIDRAEEETTKLGAARRNLMGALGSLDDETPFTIISFGERVAEWPGQVRVAGRGAELVAQAYVATLDASGGTPMAEALQLALAKEEVQAVFLVSDGRPTTGDVLGLVRRLQRARRTGPAAIYTIGIGPDQDEALLCRLAQENNGIYVKDGRITCHVSPCDDDHTIVRDFSELHPRYHHYVVTTPICETSARGCTPQAVYDIMASQARLQAPTAVTAPVQECGRLELDIGQWLAGVAAARREALSGGGDFGTRLNTLLETPDLLRMEAFFRAAGRLAGTVYTPDPVRITIDRASLSMTNHTLPDHILYPGKVTRTVLQQNDSVVVRTVGLGTGDYGDENEVFGAMMFQIIDASLALEVHRRLRP